MVCLLRFVADLENDPSVWNPQGKFVAKLPFTAGGVLGDKRSIKYPRGGVNGIVASIREFLKNNRRVAGFIPYVIIQPFFPNNSEAKVIWIHFISYNFVVELIMMIMNTYDFYFSVYSSMVNM